MLVLASALSLCATQPPVSNFRNQDIPAVIWLAGSRPEKAVKLKIQRLQATSDCSSHDFTSLSLDEAQTFSSAAGSRAPPVLPV